MTHERRPSFRALPVHVTLRLRPELSRLRQTRVFRALCRTFGASHDRFGMRLIHYSVQGNHLHLIVEAEHRQALRQGMQGLCIRLARAINAATGHRGRVFADRYHAHLLKTPPEVRNALDYVLADHESHWRRSGRAPSSRWRVDVYSSAALVQPDLRAWVYDWLGLSPGRALVADARTSLLRRASGAS